MTDSEYDKQIVTLLAINLFLCVLDLIIVVVILYFEIEKHDWLAGTAKVLIGLSIIVSLVSYAIQKHHLVREPLRIILAVEALLLILALPSL